MLAYDYPLLGIMWTVFVIFIWIAWIMLLFRVFIDIFRSHDLGGFSKAIWCIVVLLIPFLGVFVYLIARGHSMADRDIEQAKQTDQAYRSYIQNAVEATPSRADELAKLADLRAKGVVSEAEFEAEKAKLLG